jgi:hypothetical protein
MALSERMQGFMKRWADPGRPAVLPREGYVTLPWTEYYRYVGLVDQGFMGVSRDYVSTRIGAPNGYMDNEIEYEWYLKFYDGSLLHLFYKVGCSDLLYIRGVDCKAVGLARSVLF